MRIILCDDDTAFTQVFKKTPADRFQKIRNHTGDRVRTHGRGSLARDYTQADGCAAFRH